MTDLIFESGIGLLLVEASRGDGGNRPVVIPLPTSKNFACGSPLWGPSVLVFTNVLKKRLFWIICWSKMNDKEKSID